MQRVTDQIQELLRKQAELEADLKIARSTSENLQDESTAELERNIAEVEETNRKVRANLDKDKAEEDARGYREQYNALTAKIQEVRDTKLELLKKADLPLPGLTVEDGELVYNGQKWDNMSGSEQLKVSTAIVRRLNPKCGLYSWTSWNRWTCIPFRSLESGWRQKVSRQSLPGYQRVMNAALLLKTGMWWGRPLWKKKKNGKQVFFKWRLSEGECQARRKQ